MQTWEILNWFKVLPETREIVILFIKFFKQY